MDSGRSDTLLSSGRVVQKSRNWEERIIENSLYQIVKKNIFVKEPDGNSESSCSENLGWISISGDY